MTQETSSNSDTNQTVQASLEATPVSKHSIHKKSAIKGKKSLKQTQVQPKLFHKEPETEVKHATEKKPAHKVLPFAVLPFSHVAESLQSHISEQQQTLFSENVKLSKDFFKCKTVNDLLELQSRIFHLNSSAYLNNIVKMTESFVKTK